LAKEWLSNLNPKMNPSDRLKLLISTATWSRDSHGLYDYESDSVQKQQIKTSAPCFLVRKDNEIQVMEALPPAGCAVLARIEPYSRGFRIMSGAPYGGDSLWQVVRSSEQEALGIPIEPGTTVKLGRVQILVSEIAQETSPGASTLSSDDELSDDQKLCKICFGVTEELNSLISPCDCSGSVRYVHVDCLKRWLTSKCVVNQTDNFASYFWKSMHCELCKKVYPFSLTAGGREVSLFSVSKSEGVTLALELLARESHNQAVYILNTKDNTSLRLGRGHESDLRINDISVSRCHAILNIRQGQFYLKDNSSKFGTLIKLPNEIFIDRGTTLVVQTGRTVTTFEHPL
jgi:hypothetical protein